MARSSWLRMDRRAELTLTRYADLTPEEIARNVHAHPTLGEAVKEAAHGLIGHMIKPAVCSTARLGSDSQTLVWPSIPISQ